MEQRHKRKAALRKVRTRSVKVAKLKSGRPSTKRTRLAQRSRLPNGEGPGVPPPAVLEPVVRESKQVPPTPRSVEIEPLNRAPAESPQGTTLELYLREIGEVKLLTPKEEVILAKRIKRGDEQAREHMIRANLRLVVKIARDYEGLGLPLLDLINEGNIGLIKGVERFDPAKGAKLSTYASWWIKQSIKRALANQSKTIRLPIHVVDKVAHIRRAELKLREEFDRDPTDEEVASHVGIHPQRVREYRDAARAPVSLEAPLGSDSDSDQVSEVVADANAAAPFDQVVSDSDNELVREVFATLTPRERTVLSLRFGLQDDTPRTLEEIGEEFGVTRERIRQIQNEALKKLRRKVEKRDRPDTERVMALTE